MRPQSVPSLIVRATLVALMLLTAPAGLRADDREDAEKAAHALAYDQENEGFNIRAEAWNRTLEPKVGKAMRMQLYKGNEYCFCVAVPRKSGVHITGAVLDLEGKTKPQPSRSCPCSTAGASSSSTRQRRPACT